MIEKRNKYFLAFVVLLLIVCFAALYYVEYIHKYSIALVMLEGALLLLYYKKGKWWAFCCCFVLFFIWGTHTKIPFINKHIFGTVLFLLGGCFLLCRFVQTGWESYVTAGCFGISFGLFGIMALFSFFKENIFVLLFLCLAMVWYSSRSIKKRQKTILRIWLETLTVFAVVLAVLLM